MHRVVIMGAAGRDFHNFNMVYRNRDDVRVVAFTAAQIPDIEGRVYPPALAGPLYPNGIPIAPEEDLEELIRNENVDEVVFSYSDVSFQTVMEKASRVLAAGADFSLLGTKSTYLESRKPVIAVCAVRTGCGKSQTTRRILDILKSFGKNVVGVRHPMPYGDLTKQVCQRFASYEDLEKHECTIEEREEYEPYISRGFVVYAGVDYERILEEAEKEADIILWDGGNNDYPFYKPDMLITVVDPHRSGHERTYYPGMTNLLMADVLLINKVDSADPRVVEDLEKNVKALNPTAKIVKGASPVTIDESNIEKVVGKKVLVVEDGPTVTHGEMGYGAGHIAAKKYRALKIIDPRPYAVESIKETFQKYSHLSEVLPAMGYSKKQLADLRATIDRAECDIVLAGTPIDLNRALRGCSKPIIRVYYDLKEENGALSPIVKSFIDKMEEEGRISE